MMGLTGRNRQKRIAPQAWNDRPQCSPAGGPRHWWSPLAVSHIGGNFANTAATASRIGSDELLIFFWLSSYFADPCHAGR